MNLLIDAVKTLIITQSDDDIETRTLNTELADYLATRQDTIVVVTNARGDRGKKIRDLISEYSFEYHSMDNTTPKTDPEYWAHVIMYYGFDTEDCFYLDHSEDNLDAAAEIGIEGELFVNNDQAIEVLQSIVVK
jgi:FMN phosphatase YigB (HAD superfamily)